MSLVSKECVDFVKSFEGFSSVPYNDCVGVRTLGYGMTGAEIQGINYVTEEQATQMLENLLNNKYAAPIKNDLDSKGVTLTQNQFDAFVSMAYNIGVGGLLGSTLYRNVVAGVRDQATITENFQRWSMAGGQRLEGLYRRRTAEAEMFFRSDNINVNLEEEKKVKYLVVVGNSVDRRAAEYLADYLQCPVIDASLPFDYSVIEYPIGVGGTPTTNGKNEWSSYIKKVIQGNDRYDTCRAVLDYIKSGCK